METKSKLLNVRQAAQHLNISEAWLYGSGIPCVKLGRRRLYRLEDLDAWVARRVQR